MLNCIADYSEWSDIGRHLNISRAALEMIEREYPPEDRPAYMVEEWWKSTTDTFTWVTLKRALMNLRPDKFKQISLRSNSSQDLSYSLEKWKMRSGEQIGICNTPEFLLYVGIIMSLCSTVEYNMYFYIDSIAWHNDNTF